jgi:class 3 adenylate cyclase
MEGIAMTADRPGLHRLLESYWDSDKPARGELRERVWAEYGGRGAVLITDMSRFSRVTRDMGIVHYLAMIRLMQRIMAPLVQDHGGEVVKFMADNCYSIFADVPEALEAALAMTAAAAAMCPPGGGEPPLEICSGLDWGRLLLVCAGDSDGTVCDYFGDPVNVASKLGEDLAGPGEVLVARRAFGRLPPEYRPACIERTFTVSGLEISAVSIAR